MFNHLSYAVSQGLEPIPAVVGQKYRYTRYTLSHQFVTVLTHRQTKTDKPLTLILICQFPWGDFPKGLIKSSIYLSHLMANLQSSVYLTCMSLDYVRNPERAHTDTGRTCSLHTERPLADLGIEPTTLLLFDQHTLNGYFINALSSKY